MHDQYSFALGTVSDHVGTTSCYCLDLTTHVVKSADYVLIKAEVNDEAQLAFALKGSANVKKPEAPVPGGKVVLKASYQDYEALLRHVTQVRVLRAFVDQLIAWWSSMLRRASVSLGEVTILHPHATAGRRLL